MNTQLPVPERTLPRASADRIRTAILMEEPGPNHRRVNRWILGLAAVLVVVALAAVAAVLWPSASRTQVVEQPTVSPTSTSVAPTPTSTEWTMPTPTPAPSRTEPLEPGPKEKAFLTDRGPLSNRQARATADECTNPDKAKIDKVLYARQVIKQKDTLDVVVYRKPGGEEWFCAPASFYVPMDEFDPEIGPNPSFPVVTDSGQGGALDQDGATSEWVFRALASVARIQVRAVVNGEPKRWFEGEVHGGFVYIPVFTSGSFDWDEEARGAGGITYQQRAFDKEGREVPVRVMVLPR